MNYSALGVSTWESSDRDCLLETRKERHMTPRNREIQHIRYGPCHWWVWIKIRNTEFLELTLPISEVGRVTFLSGDQLRASVNIHSVVAITPLAVFLLVFDPPLVLLVHENSHRMQGLVLSSYVLNHEVTPSLITPPFKLDLSSHM